MGKYLTEKQRYQIEAYLKAGWSTKAIAEALDKSPRTIRREIKRGMVEMVSTELMLYDTYCADNSQLNYDEKKKNKGRKRKLEQDEELAIFLKDSIIKKKRSPYASLMILTKLNKSCPICLRTLYNYIEIGFFNIYNNDLPIKRNKKKKKNDKKKSKVTHHYPFHSIEDRPKEINSREEMNHWEMDCVESAKGIPTSLLVFTERVSRYELIFKIPSKTSQEVINVLDTLEKKLKNQFKALFKSITVDNGSEFKSPDLIERSLFSDEKRTTVYYCHPYCSSERGSNEKQNCMIRRHIPKSSDISKFSNKFIRWVQDWLNDYPRPMFAGFTSREAYAILSNS